MAKQTKEQQFWDDLVAVVDGEASALDAYGDLLADSVEHRDGRFEAEHAVRRLGEAGDDWQQPEDLDDRIVAAMEAQHLSPERGQPAQPATEPMPEQSGASFPDPPAAVTESPASAEQRPGRPPAAGPMRGKVIWLTAALSAAAAVGLVYAGVSLLGSDDGVTDGVPNAPLSAVLGRVARASDDGAPGVSLRGPGAESFAPIGEGTEITPGTTVRTDERTRAALALSDGSNLVLNHSTELTLSGEAPRQLSLTTGELVAEVAYLENGPRARLTTPSGMIEVLGTKFLLTATDEATTVRVTRGSVMAHPLDGESVDVKAGEEGQLVKAGSTTVTPAMEIAHAIGWSELDPGPVDGPLAGLGELRARRPGEREDQERPLTLSEQKVDVRIVGNVARTEIEQTFSNDGPHTLEGIYRFPLPPDARIASLALDVDGEWEQGAFVSRDRARRIWRGVIRNATPVAQRERNEEFIWVPGPWRDPALLEWQRGGQFELRIFPIPARGARRIRLAYTQNIGPSGAGRRYVYPLPHSGDDSTRVGRLQATVRVSGADSSAPPAARGYDMARSDDRGSPRLSFEARDFVPAGDLVVDYRPANEGAELRWWTYAGQATVPSAERSREGEPEVAEEQRQIHADERGYVVFAIRPELPAWGRGQARDYVLVLDASQSMVGERWDRASQLATRLVAEMDRRDRFMVLTCDATCQSYELEPTLPSAQAAQRLGEWLAGVRPAGASDLVRALRQGAEALSGKRQDDRTAHVIYVGDGMPSVGHRRPSSIAAELTPLAEDPRLTFSTVGIGGDADALVLSAVARAGGGHHIPYVPGQRPSAAALAVLETTFGAALEGASLQMPEGVDAVAPRRLPTIRAGQEVIVVGRLNSGEVRGDVVLAGRVGDRPFEDRYPVTLSPTTAAGNAFVPRQWAAETIQELELSGKPSEQPRIVALSKAFGVMSRHTSLLVLESEAMFQAFGVDRAQPTVQWTGEGEMVEGQSEGLMGQRAGLGHANESSSTLDLHGGRRNRRSLGSSTAMTSAGRDFSLSGLGDVAATRGRRGGGGVDDLLDGALGSQGVRLRGGAQGGGAGAVRSAPRQTGHRVAGNVSAAAPTTMGSLDRGVIQRVINSRLAAFRVCYERELMRQPNLAGRIILDFNISPTGAVSSARVGSSTMGNAAVEGCMVRQARRLRFPAPGGGGAVTVRYPFIMRNTVGGAATPQVTPPPPPVRPQLGRGQWMRREWFSVGQIAVSREVGRADLRRVEEAEAALAESPDSRDRHRALARALARTDELEGAEAAVQKWIHRDQLDPEALTLLSDLVGRSGDRLQAVRLLTGIVDLRPDDAVLHERLARAFERVDDTERACAHRVALAEIQPQDAGVVAAAVRCERALSRLDAADRLLAAVSEDAQRERADELAGEAPRAERVRGAITLEATWSGETDLDLTLVTPQGSRVSWMGGRTTVVGADAAAIGRESLGLRRAGAGSYLIEVSRADPSDDTPVTGTIRVQVLGERRSVPFRLDAGARQAVARARVERRSRTVPVR